ncbi:hypothetical protein SAMN02910297_00939 [Methanobrevibacter olleyae]|uniref:Uncharacterized protein n=1 Tax=Methanobrevibacter olleyae TaxID=294671 RepID=A0A126QYQ0_METOL|nr:hypothetical protein YLM1_0604 [Methanobrevibacter olleyae]SFL45853.1 hypothetical protein SAMN02910297_00939 [Methanobrevibacter olleyae]
MNVSNIENILSTLALMVFLIPPLIIYFQMGIPIHMLQITILLSICLIVLTIYLYYKFNKPSNLKNLAKAIIGLFIIYLGEYLNLIFNIF